jgi:hypothetical protein
MNNFKNSLHSENKAAFKPMYKCGVCDKVYDSILDRAKCEIECSRREEEAAKKAAEEKKKLEKAARKKELDDAIVRAQELLDHYVKDYGSYSHKSDNKVTYDDLFCNFFNLLP